MRIARSNNVILALACIWAAAALGTGAGREPSGGLLADEALSRSFTVTNEALKPPTFAEATSRSITVTNEAVIPPTFAEAISRSLTICNTGDWSDEDEDEVHDCEDQCPGSPDGDDCDNDGVPDGCEPDCNENSLPDDCECLADLNSDGFVGAGDLAILLASWGLCPGCPADLNCDGSVGAADLAMLLASWGVCD